MRLVLRRFLGLIEQELIFGQVYVGTQNAGREFKEAKFWDDANKWLSERR